MSWQSLLRLMVFFFFFVLDRQKVNPPKRTQKNKRKTNHNKIKRYRIQKAPPIFYNFLGFVLVKTVQDLKKRKPSNIPFLKYLKSVKDPFVMAVLAEDATACTGVIVASG